MMYIRAKDEGMTVPTMLAAEQDKPRQPESQATDWTDREAMKSEANTKEVTKKSPFVQSLRNAVINNPS